jgi:hypothetical protein
MGIFTYYITTTSTIITIIITTTIITTTTTTTTTTTKPWYRTWNGLCATNMHIAPWTCTYMLLYMPKILMFQLSKINRNYNHLAISGLGTMTGTTGRVSPLILHPVPSTSNAYRPISKVCCVSGFCFCIRRRDI